ncbi:hypothetical protein ACO2Q8_14630 [Larkinella sp. VNQ87]|uniref:hypothetical protein n=1 Tax=Larkinella sp. VNQ87 TaxID=3400921 RepID=UPI003C0E8D1D
MKRIALITIYLTVIGFLTLAYIPAAAFLRWSDRLPTPDFTDTPQDISWEEITEDLWP